MSFQPEHEIHKRRFGRNLGVGVLLGVFVALVFGLSVVKVTSIAKVDGFSGVVMQETAPQVKAP